jgi:ferredoxin
MLYIHPVECIDCEACVPECPEDAIFHEDKLPEEWIPFKDLNATMARQSAVVTTKPAKERRSRNLLCDTQLGSFRQPIAEAFSNSTNQLLQGLFDKDHELWESPSPNWRPKRSSA